MAILDAFEVKVVVDGSVAEEFPNDEADVETKAAQNVTKYVLAQSDKEFYFDIYVAPNFDWGKADTLTARARIDGKFAGGVCIDKPGPYQHARSQARLQGRYSGCGKTATLHKFAFGKLETRDATQDDKPSKMKDKYGDLGTISITFSRERSHGHQYTNQDFDPKRLKPIPEKALKGRPLDVAMTFKSEPARDPGIRLTESIESTPVAAINLKYRSRRAMQSLLIIERTPTPEPVEFRDPANMTREELEAFYRQQGPAKREPATVKRERAETNPPMMRPLKSSKGTNGQTVYHIDSDSDDDSSARPQKTKEKERSPTREQEIETITL